MSKLGQPVFLTDAQQRKTLAAVRALARHGVAPHVGDTTILSTSFFSRYCAGRMVYPRPDLAPGDWVESVARYIRAHGVECLFPMDDAALGVASLHRGEFGGCAIPLPPHETVLMAADKSAAVNAAHRAGVRCPATIAITSAAEVGEWSGGYPALVRPRFSSGSRGLRVVASPEALRDVVCGLLPSYEGGLIVQEYVPQGPKYDVCLLLDWSGRPLASFVQREIRGYPIPHGPSTLQESVSRPDLVDLALKVLESTGWRGLAEVEFMEDPRDGGAVFMEINPRFWNSLHLAIECGIDFPYLLYLLATGKDAAERHEYTVGLRCRWLLPGDILHFLANPGRWRMDPPFFQLWEPRTRDDIISLSDPGPALGFGLIAARYLVDREMWRRVFVR